MRRASCCCSCSLRPASCCAALARSTSRRIAWRWGTRRINDLAAGQNYQQGGRIGRTRHEGLTLHPRSAGTQADMQTRVSGPLRAPPQRGVPGATCGDVPMVSSSAGSFMASIMSICRLPGGMREPLGVPAGDTTTHLGGAWALRHAQ